MTIKKYFNTYAERKQYENTTKANVLNYGIEYINGIKKYYVLECAGLKKHKKALVKSCYIPNYNNIEFTMICDL